LLFERLGVRDDSLDRGNPKCCAERGAGYERRGSRE
jgi:hypothetical protein